MTGISKNNHMTTYPLPRLVSIFFIKRHDLSNLRAHRHVFIDLSIGQPKIAWGIVGLIIQQSNRKIALGGGI